MGVDEGPGNHGKRGHGGAGAPKAKKVRRGVGQRGWKGEAVVAIRSLLKGVDGVMGTRPGLTTRRWTNIPDKYLERISEHLGFGPSRSAWGREAGLRDRMDRERRKP